ncbi:hypothetical protein QJS10_CPB12g01236 [Acorus calamus]|uniref:Reverse transcriptase domain-containing protein n=1 Tax=Acorus calamus TaxID=4465 RepID=A0AAV9DPI3_ACOCL|nr:hypothetical protein QJS10_CPB12g01236 [Acorus calamus]
MLHKAEAVGWVNGLQCGRSTSSLSYVQYAEDTTLLCRGVAQEVRGVMFVVKIFGWLLGLKVNWHKSAFFGINLLEAPISTLAAPYGCPVGSFPTRYLDLPLSIRPISCSDLAPLVQRFESRMEGWLTLLQAVLSSLPIFLLSLFKIP